MSVIEFEEFIKNCRESFRLQLVEHGDENVDTFKGLLKDMLAECTSTFEENSLKEALQEEFSDYINSL